MGPILDNVTAIGGPFEGELRHQPPLLSAERCREDAGGQVPISALSPHPRRRSYSNHSILFLKTNVFEKPFAYKFADT